MASHNKTILAGTLTREADYKQLPSGHAVCHLSLVINRQFAHKGSWVKEVCHIDVDVWGPLSETSKALIKGALILVEGRLKLDSWEDQQGQKRSKHILIAERIVTLATAHDYQENNPSVPDLASDTIFTAGYNKNFLIGNLTRDPEHKQLPSGQAVCRLPLAVNRKMYNKQLGTQTQEVCYIDVDVWGAQADTCRQFLVKGRSVFIEGRLKFDSWEDQQGQKRSKHSLVAERVVFLQASTPLADDTEDTFGATHSVTSPATKAMPSSFEQTPSIDLFSSLSKPKNSNKQSENNSKPFSLGEIDYTDTPPFTDELPF